jgi:hypothetical protein
MIAKAMMATMSGRHTCRPTDAAARRIGAAALKASWLSRFRGTRSGAPSLDVGELREPYSEAQFKTLKYRPAPSSGVRSATWMRAARRTGSERWRSFAS